MIQETNQSSKLGSGIGPSSALVPCCRSNGRARVKQERGHQLVSSRWYAVLLCIYMSLYVFLCIYICIYMCFYVFIYAFICVYVYLYIISYVFICILYVFLMYLYVLYLWFMIWAFDDWYWLNIRTVIEVNLASSSSPSPCGACRTTTTAAWIEIRVVRSHHWIGFGWGKSTHRKPAGIGFFRKIFTGNHGFFQ